MSCPNHISTHSLLLILKRPGLNHNDYHKTRNDQSTSNRRNHCNAAPTCRKTPSYNPMLSFEVSIEANNQQYDADPKECRAERFAHLSQVFVGVAAAS